MTPRNDTWSIEEVHAGRTWQLWRELYRQHSA